VCMRVHLVSFLRLNHARTSHVQTQGRPQEASPWAPEGPQNRKCSGKTRVMYPP
jgi:hypothetical protein